MATSLATCHAADAASVRLDRQHPARPASHGRRGARIDRRPSRQRTALTAASVEVEELVVEAVSDARTYACALLFVPVLVRRALCRHLTVDALTRTRVSVVGVFGGVAVVRLDAALTLTCRVHLHGDVDETFELEHIRVAVFGIATFHHLDRLPLCLGRRTLQQVAPAASATSVDAGARRVEERPWIGCIQWNDDIRRPRTTRVSVGQHFRYHIGTTWIYRTSLRKQDGFFGAGNGARFLVDVFH